jgi:hypothetical protein
LILNKEEEEKNQTRIMSGKRYVLFQGRGEMKTDYLHIKKLRKMNDTIKFCWFVCVYLF